MLSIAAILVHTTRYIKRWKNQRLLTNIIQHKCDGNNCVLDLDFSGTNCVVYGPKFYHSCIEKSYLGLLFRVLHYMMFDESDYGHRLALTYYSSDSIYAERCNTKRLYNLLSRALPEVKTFITKKLLSLPYNQYDLLSPYIEYEKKIDHIRNFNHGMFRHQEVSKWLDIEYKHKKVDNTWPITFRLKHIRYGNSVLVDVLVEFGGKHWRKITSCSKPLVLDLMDIISVERNGLLLKVVLADDCIIELSEDEAIMKSEDHQSLTNESCLDSNPLDSWIKCEIVSPRSDGLLLV